MMTLTPDVQRAIGLGAFMTGAAVLGFVALSECGCASPAARAAEAESAYLAEQLRCVDAAHSRDEADACRRQVRARWGIVETSTSRDGGAR